MLLEVENLNIFFKSEKTDKPLHAIKNLSFNVKKGEMLGVVGESGSGKSITNLAFLGLLPENAIVNAKKCLFNNSVDLINESFQWEKIRGKQLSMIFQDPMSALNPFLSVEFQLCETILAHTDLSKKESKNKAVELLQTVGIPSPMERLKSYPFELSGGMAQRVMIAMSIATNPLLLIADEPTTALDVTIQKQILLLLKELQEKNNMSIILVTHDLGVVSEYCERIQVMYAGEIIESATTRSLLTKPQHPYTEALLKSRPGLIVDQKPRIAKSPLPTISGIVPSFNQRPSGCQFHPRCAYKKQDCEVLNIELIKAINTDDSVRCLYSLGESK